MLKDPKISIITVAFNSSKTIKGTIESIISQDYNNIEYLIIDGGSKDGTANWLAKQKNILSIIQPNYIIKQNFGLSKLKYSWGNFINIAFKMATSDFIVMISDDLILNYGCLQNGFDEMINRINNGENIGGGAFYFREYPRMQDYRIGLLPRKFININHGIYNKNALKSINYFNEIDYNFYCSDGDLAMRLNFAGWKTIALENSFSNHLVHLPQMFKSNPNQSIINDIKHFQELYSDEVHDNLTTCGNNSVNLLAFWIFGFKNCIMGLLMRIYDKRFR